MISIVDVGDGVDGVCDDPVFEVNEFVWHTVKLNAATLKKPAAKLFSVFCYAMMFCTAM